MLMMLALLVEPTPADAHDAGFVAFDSMVALVEPTQLRP